MDGCLALLSLHAWPFTFFSPQPYMNSPSVRSTLPASLTLALVGWGGLAYLIIYTLPTVWNRWLFFFLGILAISGLMLPLVAFLNRRFPTQPPATTGTLVRESAFFGLYFAIVAWLQLGRVLTPALAALIAFGLTLIEFLIRLREQARWEP